MIGLESFYSVNRWQYSGEGLALVIGGLSVVWTMLNSVKTTLNQDTKKNHYKFYSGFLV